MRTEKVVALVVALIGFTFLVGGAVTVKWSSRCLMLGLWHITPCNDSYATRWYYWGIVAVCLGLIICLMGLMWWWYVGRPREK
ncbi:MAG TPA: hypothetical protein VJA27_02375 [Patescibacteria group bacterium]|nr:hypothetical protein [Patescibacteria group bacterium]